MSNKILSFIGQNNGTKIEWLSLCLSCLSKDWMWYTNFSLPPYTDINFIFKLDRLYWPKWVVLSNFAWSRCEFMSSKQRIIRLQKCCVRFQATLQKKVFIWQCFAFSFRYLLTKKEKLKGKHCQIKSSFKTTLENKKGQKTWKKATYEFGSTTAYLYNRLNIRGDIYILNNYFGIINVDKPCRSCCFMIKVIY